MSSQEESKPAYRRITRVMDSTGGVPRAGKIRLGIVKQNSQGKEYPSEVDYFVLDPDLTHRDRIVKFYGERPKRLLVMFLTDDLEVAFPTAYKAYSSALGLVCKGDGQTALRVEVEEITEPGRKGQPPQVRRRVKTDRTGAKITVQRECPCEWLETDRCRAVGNLFVVMPEISLTSTFQIDTGSWHTMRNILAAFDHARALTGRIRDVLFWLERVPQETHGSGRSEVHFPLRLRMLEPEEDALHRDRIRQRLLQYRPLLGGNVKYEALPELPDGIEEDDIVRGAVVADAAAVTRRSAEPLADPVPPGEPGGDEPEPQGEAPALNPGAEPAKEAPKVRRGAKRAAAPAGAAPEASAAAPTTPAGDPEPKSPAKPKNQAAADAAGAIFG